ncbi:MULTISPECIES: hypothetical protein [unclassified Microbacterium]|uniref:hypothetical protein n=1 Tax=unclassified Microbacterium TaxID=2609290 RepID=UPI003430473F
MSGDTSTVANAGITKPERVLAVFDAALSWSDENSPKGCSAINARAEVGEGNGDHPVFPEVTRQKAWLLALFAELCAEAGVQDPARMAEAMMLLYEGAIVTVGMATFDEPFAVARRWAATLLDEG